MSALHLVCPHCFAVNRVPTERLGDAPKCGRCHEATLPGKPVDLGAANFEVFTSRNDLPVVVDFWAAWCGPCKMMAPAFAEAARQMNGQVQFAKVDTEAEQALAGRFAIRSIPTLVLFRHGKEVDRVSGALSAAQLTQWLKRHA